MDDPNLDQALHRLREQTGHATLPPALQQNVWRMIRQRRAVEAERATRWSALFEGLLLPRMVLASLAVAAALGVGIGMRAASQTADRTRAALDLSVFGHEAPALPATLLAAQI